MNEQNKKVNLQLTTPEFRTSFPVVFQAKKMDETDVTAKAKFSITMLFDKTNPKVLEGLKAMETAVATVLNAKFGSPDRWPRKGDGTLALRLPFRNGAEKNYDGYGPNIIFVSASSEMKPGLVFSWPGPDGKTPASLTDPKDFYAGCYARATVNPYYYDRKGNKGVAFGLRNIQKLRDGEAFGGGKKAEADFDAIDTPPADLAALDNGMNGQQATATGASMLGATAPAAAPAINAADPLGLGLGK